VRGAGLMLGFDVQRADLRDALLDRAFRRGLVLLPAAPAACVLSSLRHRNVCESTKPCRSCARRSRIWWAGASPRRPRPRRRSASAHWRSRSTRSSSWISRRRPSTRTSFRSSRWSRSATEPRPRTRRMCFELDHGRCSSSRSRRSKRPWEIRARSGSRRATRSPDGSWATPSAARSRTTMRKASLPIALR